MEKITITFNPSQVDAITSALIRHYNYLINFVPTLSNENLIKSYEKELLEIRKVYKALTGESLK